MEQTYRLDVRYVPEQGVRVLDRYQSLITNLADAGFEVIDGAVIDDGMRVSLVITSSSRGRPELKLLAMVSDTGTIGRFSCRRFEIVAEDQPQQSSQIDLPVLA